MLIWLTPLQMSLYGGLAVLAALAVRTAGRRRLPSGVLSWLWLLAALRFLLPVSVSGPASVDVSALLPRPLPSVSLPAPLPGTAAADAEALPAAPDGLDVPWPVLVWAVGALVLLLSPVGGLGFVLLNVFLTAVAASLVNPRKDALLQLNLDPQERARLNALIMASTVALSSPFGYLAGWLSSMDRRLPFGFMILLFLLAMAVVGRIKEPQVEEAKS